MLGLEAVLAASDAVSMTLGLEVRMGCKGQVHMLTFGLRVLSCHLAHKGSPSSSHSFSMGQAGSALQHGDSDPGLLNGFVLGSWGV